MSDASDRQARSHDIALVLSGGNALGAYQAGAYQTLHQADIEPDWIAGASAGAINGAIICGNPADQRLARLTELWKPRFDSSPASGAAGAWDESRRTTAALWALLAGQPDIFLPRPTMLPWDRGAASLYDASPLTATLERLVDFERLNAGLLRFSATAVDIESGEDVVFDTRRHTIGPHHLRASSALLPAFAPVEIGDRLLGDAGISVNLPLDTVLSDLPPRPLLCVAIDLLPLAAPRPRALGETISRVQDLIFATQSRRAIAAWQAIFRERAGAGSDTSVTLIHIAYSDQQREVSGKAFDFSPESAAFRWQAGRDAMTAIVAALQAGRVPLGEAGLTVLSPEKDGALSAVDWPVGPVAG